MNPSALQDQDFLLTPFPYTSFWISWDNSASASTENAELMFLPPPEYDMIIPDISNSEKNPQDGEKKDLTLTIEWFGEREEFHHLVKHFFQV